MKKHQHFGHGHEGKKIEKDTESSQWVLNFEMRQWSPHQSDQLINFFRFSCDAKHSCYMVGIP